jgi:hypothetical protein
LGPHLEDFLAQLFGIAPEVQALEASTRLAPLFAVKRQFVRRKRPMRTRRTKPRRSMARR